MRILSGHGSVVHRVAYAPNDPLTLASASNDGTVRLWNPLTGENWATFHEPGILPWALAFSSDGSLLATAGTVPLLADESAIARQVVCEASAS